MFARPPSPADDADGRRPRKVNDDWTFEINGLADRRIIGANVTESADWTVKAVYHNGIDITDTRLEFTPGQDVEGVQIVFTNRRTELSGLITDDRASPISMPRSSRSRRIRGAGRRDALRADRTAEPGRTLHAARPASRGLLRRGRAGHRTRAADRPEYLGDASARRQPCGFQSLAEGESRAQDLKSPPARKSKPN